MVFKKKKRNIVTQKKTQKWLRDNSNSSHDIILPGDETF